jgi:nucleotide-binding universal stress UspA family protein
MASFSIMTAKPTPPSQSKSHPKRKFLVVVDTSDECRVATRYAARRAQHTNGIVTLLCIIGPSNFQQWGGVERVMREEAHEEAERLLHDWAKYANDLTGNMPELIIREGRTEEEIRKLFSEEVAVSILVLAAGTSKEGPGPLVSALAGKGDPGYTIPVTVVPGNLSDEAIDALA